MISKETIEKVFEIARVEEVIGDFVQLKRAGSNMKGLSPFVNEKSPSFMVSPVKQIWKDFSSGKGGNAVTFLMEHEHFTYPEAIKYLANKYKEFSCFFGKRLLCHLNGHYPPLFPLNFDKGKRSIGARVSHAATMWHPVIIRRAND